MLPSAVRWKASLKLSDMLIPKLQTALSGQIKIYNQIYSSLAPSCKTRAIRCRKAARFCVAFWIVKRVHLLCTLFHLRTILEEKIMYKITSQAHFDAAHFLFGYNGKCRNIHGHRWVVSADIAAENLRDDPQERGMVTDFGSFKKLSKYFFSCLLG